MRDPNHECPHPAASPLAKRLEALHKTQSGARRHRCVACAYNDGFVAGEKAAKADQRVSSWSMGGPAEMCEEGRSAPQAMLSTLDANQGEHRHGCAVCAWTVGWRDGVDTLR